jgi:peptidoglycan hydrolase-like protein with peptidoglycan-binding domain
MRRVFRVVVAMSVALIVATGAAPAAANHEDPHDGPDHYYGEMVDYPLVFPVEGDYWYEDWFWAARGSGTHHAQDIMAPKMTPVVAAAAGTVTWINWSQNPADLNPERCCTLVISHDDGWESWYIHLNNDTPGTDDGEAWGIAPGIELGVHVEAGTLLGWVGDSGSAEDTPPHLHYELYDPDMTLVNPYDSLLAAEGRSTCAVGRFAEIDALVDTDGLVMRGAVGAAVEQLQEALYVLGFDPNGVDGSFGPLTEGAVRGFQDDRGLAIDGIVGDQTKGTLADISEAAEHIFVLDPDGRNLSMGALGGDVRELQHLLVVMGLDPGPVDGVFGLMTTGAVRTYQESAGISIDGVVGPGTRLSMARTLGLSRLINCSS